MSGVVVVDKGRKSAWMKAGWAFDNVMKRLAIELNQAAPDLAEEILNARTDVSGGYYDLSGMDARTFRVLLKAADNAYAHLLSEDPSLFYDPSYRSTFVASFAELKDMLHADTRARAE
jgi:hypothetical protein